MYFLSYDQSNIKLGFCVTDDKELKFVQCSQKNKIDTNSLDPADYYWNRLVEVHLSGGNQNDHHFAKHTGSSESFSLKYVRNEEIYVEDGTIFYIEQENDKINVKTYFRFYHGIEAFKTWSVVKNISSSPIVLEHVSSFNFLGLGNEEDWENTSQVYLPHNYWKGECRWRKYPVKELGLYDLGVFSGKRIAVSNTGTWSSQEYLPMGIFENTKEKELFLWQIESSSSWNWEISTMPGQSKLYLMLNGPSFSENGWSKVLKPQEEFETVHVSLTLGQELEEVINNITMYRRTVRRKNEDNDRLPVIFNDYMNCLFADPTTEKEIPLIDKAAELGCEYYCIDAGWYSEGYWWDNVGEWQPCAKRFNNDFVGLLNYIREKGMIPGLWLEIEVMGVNCPLAKQFPDECFFMRNGKRVIDHSRYQLDFSHPKVVEYADSVIKRLVEDYKVGYIKMDYNINAGMGTECGADSFGDGLMRHTRAYLAWLDKIFEKYPQLIIENCASGGCRMDYAMLKRHSIQSTSDQTDYRDYSVISANCAAAVTPEQAAVWSYPLADGDEEEVAYNMVNCLLFRIHQSGHLCNLSQARYRLVEEAVRLYKNTLRKEIPNAFPVWPVGFAKGDDRFITFGLKVNGKIYLAVWNNKGMRQVRIPLEKYRAKSCRVLYPAKLPTKYEFRKESAELIFYPHQEYCARLFEIKL